VRSLEARDIQLFEDETECKTVKIESIAWPMKLTVLVDNGTRSSDYLVSLREGLREFFFELPDGVEVSLLTTAPQPRWIVRPTTDRQQLVNAIGLIAPDSAAGQFFEALTEAGTRIERDKSDHFPVIMMITSDIGSSGHAVKESDYERLQKQMLARGGTVHIVLIASGAQALTLGDVRGRVQTTIGTGLTKLTGGRYESIAAPSRLPNLLAEFSRQIADSQRRQSPQFRVTYEPAAGKRAPQRLFVNLLVPGYSVIMTSDGHIPAATSR
jgi:hypothetical protein